MENYIFLFDQCNISQWVQEDRLTQFLKRATRPNHLKQRAPQWVGLSPPRRRSSRARAGGGGLEWRMSDGPGMPSM